MESEQSNDVPLNELQSLTVIREMIIISKNQLKNNGILFIIWGWAFAISYLVEFLKSKLVITYRINQWLNTLGIILPLIVLAYTGYHLYASRRKATTYISISLRYVWISLFLCLVLINLIQNNVMHEINFNLQHPLFMVIIAFAIVITGGILRYKLLIGGGVLFAILGYICSLLPLEDQLFLEAIAWVIAFIIPGHIMYARRKKQVDV